MKKCNVGNKYAVWNDCDTISSFIHLPRMLLSTGIRIGQFTIDHLYIRFTY